MASAKCRDNLKKYNVKFNLHYRKSVPLEYRSSNRNDDVTKSDIYYACDEKDLFHKISSIYLNCADILDLTILKVSKI